jgi:hypothetical protein
MNMTDSTQREKATHNPSQMTISGDMRLPDERLIDVNVKDYLA